MKPRYRSRIGLRVPVRFTWESEVGQGQILDLTVPGCLIESPTVRDNRFSLRYLSLGSQLHSQSRLQSYGGQRANGLVWSSSKCMIRSNAYCSASWVSTVLALN